MARPQNPNKWNDVAKGGPGVQKTWDEAHRARQEYGQFTPLLAGSDKYGTTTGMNSSNRGTLNDWANDTSGAKPWLSRGEAAVDTRNNYRYGGYEKGAEDFNAEIDAAGESVTGDYNHAQGNAYRGIAGAAGMQADAAGRSINGTLSTGALQADTADHGRQVAAYDQLAQFAADGPGPSAAQATLNQATTQNMGNTLALARSGRGMGGSQAALSQAMGQNAQTQQQANNQAAVIRAQEAQDWQAKQLNAYGQMGGIAGQARGADVAAGQYVTGARQGVQDRADATGLGYGKLAQDYNSQVLAAASGKSANNASSYGLQNQVNNADLQGSSNYEQNLLDFYRVQHGGDGANNQANADRTMKYVGAGIQAAATTAAAVSDVRAKKDIVPLSAAKGVASGAEQLSGGDSTGIASSFEQLAKYIATPKAKAAKALPKIASEDPEVAQHNLWDGYGKTAKTFARSDHPILSEGDALLADSARKTPGSMFKYKDPKDGAGTYVAPMAQDLAKSPVTAGAVEQGKDGKLGVNGGRLALANTAQNHAQQNQLDELDGKISSLEELLNLTKKKRPEAYDQAGLDDAWRRGSQPVGIY